MEQEDTTKVEPNQTDSLLGLSILLSYFQLSLEKHKNLN